MSMSDAQRAYDNMEPKDNYYDFAKEKDEITSEMEINTTSQEVVSLMKRLEFYLFPQSDPYELMVSKEERVKCIEAALDAMINGESFFK